MCFMARKDDIKKLIENHYRRLQRLREQQALEGISVDPKIVIEIEDIQASIEELQTELKRVEAVQEPAPPISLPESAEESYEQRMLEQRIDSLKRQLDVHIRNLNVLEEQSAKFGLDSPVSLSNQIAVQRETIVKLEEELSYLETQLDRISKSAAPIKFTRVKEEDWLTWEREIQEKLLDTGMVNSQDLRNIPVDYREFSIDEFFDKHRNQLAITFKENQLVLANKEQIAKFTTSWKQASSYLTSLPKSPFIKHCLEILDCLRDLGLHVYVKETQTFDRLHGILVDIPSLNLNIPERLPFVFVQKERLAAEDIEDIMNLKNQMGMEGAYFIILIIFNNLTTEVENKVRIESSIYGIDLCIFNKDLLKGFLASKTGEKELMQKLVEQTSLAKISPYLVTGPAPDSVFFGREKEVSRVLASIHTASMAIVGGRKIGKTSTLNKIERVLSRRKGIYSIYIDCFTIREYKTFFDRLNTTLGDLNLPRFSYDPLKFSDVVSAIQQKVGSKRIVFLMDEVDALLKYDKSHSEDLFGTFRSLSQEGKSSFVFCGAKTLYSSLHDPKSGLFNFCDTLRLGYLDAKNLKKLVEIPMKQMGVKLENAPSLLRAITSRTSGHPNLVQYICREIINIIDSEYRRNVTLDDFTLVSESANFREFFKETIWGDTTPLERLIMLSLVESKSLTDNEISEALDKVNVNVDLTRLQEALRGLRLYSIITSVGNKYTFVPKAFPELVKYSQNIDLLRKHYKQEWENEKIES